MSKVLRSLVRQKSDSGYLIGPLNEQLLALAAKEAGDRRDQKFHPSQLSTGFCPREWALFQYEPGYEMTKLAGITGRSMRIFANGHSLHERVQRWLGDAGLLWGWWTYRDADGKVQHRYGWKPKDAPEAKYDELVLVHPDDHILGATDGIVYAKKAKLVLEVKSINERGFGELKTDGKPKDSHIQQSDIYLHCLLDAQKRDMASTSNMPAFDQLPYEGTLILYENKNTQELLEFFVPIDHDRIAKMMADHRPRMQAALAYGQGGPLPGCRCRVGKQSAACARYEREHPHA